ncbi:polysaccharide pyruvyl transferase family protein [Zobellia sp. 1_MG-2023]|uniref:polysaccharide pyruvyl transferase family protein n=1 Tax=Zobellia sp. 1_MG-2023 TaxID=3062626 RepID=UPI0026E12D8C|nr:polysaccharide pyruvyl transferase family protein [Zobellia sp. 1_MG-2023]MDO6817591.1 polysaccharide pyruvyl transferase family protein [Zobellia sp. 1_MG-2023]
MLKIGIMTTQDALNNGAMLQAYALQTYLQSLGHNVEFIDYRTEGKLTIRSFIAKSPLVMWNKWMDIYNEAKFRRRADFGDLLNRGESTFYTLKEIQNNPPKCDVYIAGSDQIWNVSSRNTINRAFYLDFGGKEIKKISYAASMGQCDVPEFLNEEIHDLVERFNSVSLRETKAVNFIQSLFSEHKKIYHVPDPTFLLSKDEYLKFIISDDEQWKKKYIASYILVPSRFDEKLRQAVKFVTTHIGVDLVNLRNPGTCVRLENAKNTIVAPREWLRYVYYSQFMICCSFHAVVFSLILHKPFIVITPYENQRIASLLNPLGLSGRIVMGKDEQKLKEIIDKEIDWHEVDALMEREKSKGQEFLRLSLN